MHASAACTVLIDGRAVRRFAQSAAQAHAADVVTVDALRPPREARPLQRAFVRRRALSRGFCVPRVLCSSKRFLNENSDPDKRDARDVVSSNNRRSAGYAPIVAAILEAAADIGGDR